jgi:hypothetical protein
MKKIRAVSEPTVNSCLYNQLIEHSKSENNRKQGLLFNED